MPIRATILHEEIDLMFVLNLTIHDGYSINPFLLLLPQFDYFEKP